MGTLTENWLLIGNSYYIIYHFYNMSWNISNLNDYHIANQLYGGSIAVIQKAPVKQTLMIFSASGKLISSKEWIDAPVIGIYWAENENLFLLLRSGMIEVFTLHGEYLKIVKMGESVKDKEVKSFRFFQTLQGTGLVVLAENNNFYYKTNLLNTQSSIVRIMGSKQFFTDPLNDWTVLSTSSSNNNISNSSSGDVVFSNNSISTLVIFVNKNELIVFENGRETQIHGRDYPWYRASNRICKLALSMSQQKLAMLYDDGSVYIVHPTNLTQILAEYQLQFTINMNSQNPQLSILQMQWAGEDFLAVYYPDNLYFMDLNQPNESSERFYMDEPLMFPEIDGVRLITVGKHEFVQKIPYELEQLYQFRSDSPSVCLFDAQTYLDNNSYDTARFIEQLKSKDGCMRRAIDSCLMAASYCLEPQWQKTILKAVRLGRSFICDYKSDKVMDVHNKLLLLNNLKLPFVAMPLTMSQLDQMTMPVLLDRLISRRYYPFVERICQRQPTIAGGNAINRMLEHWAEMKLVNSNTSTKESEIQFATALIDRLRRHKHFDYSRLASLACNQNKMMLAQKLLENEHRIEEQVKILLKIGNSNLALDKAVQSGSNDLISYVVNSLKNGKMDYSEFLHLIQRFPAAKCVYLEHLMDPIDQQNERSKIESENRSDTALAKLKLKSLVKCETVDLALSSVNNCHNLLKRAGNDFMVQTLDDQKTLWNYLSASFKDGASPAGSSDTINPVTVSLYDYIEHLYDQRMDDRAKLVRNKLRVPERQMEYLRILSYMKNDRWSDVQQLLLTTGANSQNTTTKLAGVIGYYELAELCVDPVLNHNNEMALKLFDCLVDKVDPERRVRLLVKIDRMSEAEELAKTIRSDYLVSYVTALKFNFN